MENRKNTMPLRSLLKHEDLLLIMCRRMENAKQLALTSGVCRKLKRLLLESKWGRNLWWEVLKEQCLLKEGGLSREDPLNRARRMVCPWLFGTFNVKPMVRTEEKMWVMTEMHQWMVEEEELYIRCQMGRDEAVLGLSCGLCFGAERPGVVKTLFRNMDVLEDAGVVLSPRMLEMRDQLGAAGFFPMGDDDDFDVDENVILYPIHACTFVLIVIKEVEPTVHVFHVEKKDSTKHLHLVRTFYIADLDTSITNPVMIWKQQLFIALRGGLFQVWGALNHGCNTHVTPVHHDLRKIDDVMHRYMGMLQNEDGDNFVSLMAEPKHRARVLEGCNIGIGTRGKTLLQTAASVLHEDSVSWLLTVAKADPNAVGRNTEETTCVTTVLVNSSITGDIARHVCVYAGGDVRKETYMEGGETPLLYAVYEASVHNDVHALAHCLKYGGDKLMEHKDLENEESPVSLAVRYQSVATLSLLLKNGARIEEAEKELNAPVRQPTHTGNMQRFLRHYRGEEDTYATERRVSLMRRVVEKARLQKESFSLF